MPPAPASSAPATPGSFTQLFQSPVQSAAPAPAAPTPAQSEVERNFARQFDGPLAGYAEKQIDFSKLPTQPAPPPATGTGKPGDFTMMFGNPASKSNPSAPFNKTSPAAPSNRSSISNNPGATSIFAANRPATAAPPPKQNGPGEYTRMFSAPATAPPTAGTQPAPGAPPAPAANLANSNSRLILIVALFVLFVLAVALVLFFALRH
jgi:hypothetical protein